MGRAQGRATVVAVRRGGAPGAFGRRSTVFSESGRAPTGAGSLANKFHVQDLQHFPRVIEVANQIRERALARGLPAYSHHAVSAREDDHLRSMSEAEVTSALERGRIVELNDGPDHDDCRMLVRDENGVCVVYSVGLHRIITCWWNDPADQHTTLDLSNYQRLQPGNVDESKASAQRLHRLIACGSTRATSRATSRANVRASSPALATA